MRFGADDFGGKRWSVLSEVFEVLITLAESWTAQRKRTQGIVWI
jgi:hypothetical protein